MTFQTSRSIRAVDARTGALKWEYPPKDGSGRRFFDSLFVIPHIVTPKDSSLNGGRSVCFAFCLELLSGNPTECYLCALDVTSGDMLYSVVHNFAVPENEDGDGVIELTQPDSEDLLSTSMTINEQGALYLIVGNCLFALNWKVTQHCLMWTAGTLRSSSRNERESAWVYLFSSITQELKDVTHKKKMCH